MKNPGLEEPQKTSKALHESFPGKIICFSHLRWDFVFQRPQQLMSRLAGNLHCSFWEEPVFEQEIVPHLRMESRGDIRLIVPHLPESARGAKSVEMQKNLLQGLLHNESLDDYTFWYITPMALEFSIDFKPALTVYDCMDELSTFLFAPKELIELEEALLHRADLVFTGGFSLFEAKENRHRAVFPFPSSIDKKHFQQARKLQQSPIDQLPIQSPRLGFFGVIDERFDRRLIEKMALLRPDWQLVLIGPVVKIDPAILPQLPNIHYLGQKSYEELPAYLAGWDIALIPFMMNDATRFISPTKTPEYLAAGVPVISTPIRDVVRPYGDKNLVQIASDAAGFIAHAETILGQQDRAAWLGQVDAFLNHLSWDQTVLEMLQRLEKAFLEKIKEPKDV